MNREDGVLCWHRLRIVRRRHLCRYCGVQVEQCPCVINRVEDARCVACHGSGWVAVVRGSAAKFAEYVSRVG
jgi:hypothetical protein